MKIKILLALLICFNAFSQENENKEKVSVDNSVFGIQTGFLGVWLYNEIKLNDNFALRSEIGAEPRISINVGTVFSSVLRLEPRYYYNLEKRINKGKDISNNAGNFFGLNINYRPSTVIYRTKDYLTPIESFSIVPKWGLRRNLGKNFNYELGAGLGFRHEFKGEDYGELDLHLRIGYTF
jgi:hypothetical protein